MRSLGTFDDDLSTSYGSWIHHHVWKATAEKKNSPKLRKIIQNLTLREHAFSERL